MTQHTVVSREAWVNAGYHYLDLVPKGRDEAGLAYSMEWLRRRDQYDE